MPQVFISYSRKDKEFARRLTDALAMRKLDSWVDWQDIPPSADWVEEVYKGAETSDVFLFIVSPDSARSEICRRELDFAAKNGKRIIPVVARNTNPGIAPPEVSRLNWIFFREEDDFGQALELLVKAIKTDLNWVEVHTRLQRRALEWQKHDSDKSLLLRGNDLRQAEAQIGEAGDRKDPRPTDLQRQYVLESRKEDDRIRKREEIGRWSTILIVFALLTIPAVAWWWLVQGQYNLARMTGEFNIAVVPFMELQGDKLIATDEGTQVAAIFANRLNTTAKDIFNTENINTVVRGPGPSALPALSAHNINELDQNAESLSEKIGAQIVIYGIIENRGYNGILITPMFYLSPETFGGAQELLGSHTLGEPVVVQGDSQIKANRDLQIRTEVISLVLKGLAAYIDEDYNSSLDYLGQARDLRSDQGTLAVIYMLMGNTDAKLGQMFLIQGNIAQGLDSLAEAEDAYENALKINPEYARAYLGLSGIEHIKAIYPSQKSGSFADIDLGSIQQEEQFIIKAENAKDKPATADVNTKVTFARAQINLLYATYAGLNMQRLNEAISGYNQVIQAYSNGDNPRLRELAASAFSGLGITDRLKGETSQAIKDTNTALKLTQIPSRRALYLVYLGDIYLQLNNDQIAKQYFGQALALQSDLKKTMPQEQIDDIHRIMDGLK